MNEITKPVAGQSKMQSCHAYIDGQVRCIGNGFDARVDYCEWPDAEKTIIHKFMALVSGKLGEYESKDQASIEAQLDENIAEKKAAMVAAREEKKEQQLEPDPKP